MKSLICIRCPRGCQLEIDEPVTDPLVVRGNACRLGLDFARDEYADPRRFLCTAVKVINGTVPLVSVWTPAAIPKSLVLPLMEQLRSMVVEAPIDLDQAILVDALGTGVPVVASMAVGRRHEPL